MPTAEPDRTDERTSAPDPAPGGQHQMDSRMMWAMMIGCCLAVPLALIIGGAGVAGLAGASPWLVGAGVVLAGALVVVRRRSTRADCEMPSGRDR